MTFTFVSAYYENPTMLQMHMDEWRKMKRDQIEVVIVDDGSQDFPAHLILQEKPVRNIRVRCARIIEDKPWNQDGARNLGMTLCDTNWALMTDMDHMLEADQVEGVLRQMRRAKPLQYFMPLRRQAWNDITAHAHPNSYLMSKDGFWAMGGYDEDFAGVYGSDGNFRKCMRAGMSELHTNDFVLTQYRRDEIPDASTNRYGRKESKYYRINFPLLEQKRKGPPYRAVNPIRFNWIEERVQ